MSEAIVFISHSKVKEGMLARAKRFASEMTAMLDETKPGTIVFLTYADEDGSHIHTVHVFPDAAAMDAHLVGVGERADAAFEFIETVGYEIFGTPNESTIGAMRGFADRLGVPLMIRPQSVAGYVRGA
jgi:hypothetical protein